MQRSFPLLFSPFFFCSPSSAPHHPSAWAFLAGAGVGSPWLHGGFLPYSPPLFPQRFGEAAKHFPLIWTSHFSWLVGCLNYLVKVEVREIYFHPLLESSWEFLLSQEKIRFPSIMEFGDGKLMEIRGGKRHGRGLLFGPMTLTPNAKTQKDSKRYSRGFLRFVSSSLTR